MKEDEENGKKEGGGPAPCVVIDRRPTYSDEAPPPEPRYPSMVTELQARADEAERRAREISAAYRRIEEERDAFRERLTRDLERRVDIARAELLRKVLAVADDLERAIDAAPEVADPDPLLEGVALIRDRLLKTLADEGVEPIETTGQPFDPELAEAVATETIDDPERDNVVLEELQRGYTLRGTLLRPARVRVGRASGDGDQTPPDEAQPEL
jgi:molecular chaperone GrpE